MYKFVVIFVAYCSVLLHPTPMPFGTSVSFWDFPDWELCAEITCLGKVKLPSPDTGEYSLKLFYWILFFFSLQFYFLISVKIIFFINLVGFSTWHLHLPLNWGNNGSVLTATYVFWEGRTSWCSRACGRVLLPSRINKHASAGAEPLIGVDGVSDDSAFTKGKCEGRNFPGFSFTWSFNFLTNILLPLFGIVFIDDNVYSYIAQVSNCVKDFSKNFESFLKTNTYTLLKQFWFSKSLKYPPALFF